MRLTKEEMILSIKNHTSNKIPNWPPEIVKQFIEVIENYPFESYETPISSVYSDRLSKAIKRPSFL